MSFDFQGSKHIRPLSHRWHTALQVLIPEFVLTKSDGGSTLELRVDEGLPSVVDKHGKEELQRQISAAGIFARKKLEAELREFYEDPRLLSYRFDCSEHPLRYANGGVLPIVRIDSQDHFCFFLRDADPVGWNIANGASDNLEEMADPARIILREFGEEVFICDHEQKFIYSFYLDEKKAPPGYQGDALEAWCEKLASKGMKDYQRLPIPLHWVEGPDRVNALVPKQANGLSDGYFLSMTPEDSAIEVDRVARINLKGEISILDGEYRNGVLLDRIVGLFPVDEFLRDFRKNEKEGTASAEYKPTLVFRNGVDKERHDLNDLILEYLGDLEAAGFRTREERATYLERADRFSLCPITSAVLRKYADWDRSDRGKIEASQRPSSLAQMNSEERFDVFLSHKREVQQIARGLYQCLKQAGHRVFFSGESLMEAGVSAYCDSIDRALASATCLVVVGTRGEHFESGWVGYEWRSFVNEIHSGRKDGRVFTLSGASSIDELPFALRHFQVIMYSAASPQDSFETVSRFVGGPLAD